jgi:transcriptional regulator with XRE-family HTH domain
MDEPAEIGRRVQRLRTAKGMTQRQLAEPSYTAAYVSTLEAGRVRPSEAALRFLAGRLGTSYEELATGRPARLATELRLGLTDAQRALATGSAAEAAGLYGRLLADAERHGLAPERAEAHLGLGDCALAPRGTSRRRSGCSPTSRCRAGRVRCAAAPWPICSPGNCGTPAICWSRPSTS